MKNVEHEQLIELISKYPINLRLKLLETIGKKRYNVFYPENIVPTRKTNELYNHELELIAMLSVVTDNRANYSIIPTEQKWLYDAVNVIRGQSYLSPLFDSVGALGAIAGLLFMQSQGQKIYSNLYYRYDFIYNYVNENINMVEVFKSFFGVEFQSFLDLCFLTATYKEFDKVNDLNWFYEKLNEDLKKVFNHLSIKRNGFIELHNQISRNHEIYSFFDLNLLLKYPFIEYNGKIYCPWYPYIPYACTENLMFVITKDDNDLRSLIGKNVIEAYVLNLFEKAKYSNNLKIDSEIIYGKEHHHTSDVILTKNSEVLLIEIKFMNQSLKLRDISEKEIDTFSERLAKGFSQLTRNINSFIAGEFNERLDIECSTAKGLLLTYDSYYFHREQIYKKAISILESEGIIITLDELKSKVLLMSLNNLENILTRIDDDFISYTDSLFRNPTSWLDMQYSFDGYDPGIDGIPDIQAHLSKMLDKFEKNLESLINLK